MSLHASGTRISHSCISHWPDTDFAHLVCGMFVSLESCLNGEVPTSLIGIGGVCNRYAQDRKFDSPKKKTWISYEKIGSAVFD